MSKSRREKKSTQQLVDELFNFSKDSKEDVDTASTGSQASGNGSQNGLHILERMTFPSVILFIGKPARGKTYATRYLVKSLFKKDKRFRFLKVFTGSYYNADYDYVPPKAVAKGYNSAEFKSYHQRLIEAREGSTQDKFPHNIIILDDLLGQLQADKYFENFVSTYRHTNTTVIICNQYLASRATTTSVREFTRYAFLFRTKAESALKQYYSWFGSLFDSLDEFKAHFFTTTSEKNQAMLYIEDEDELENNYIPFKAPSKESSYRIEF